MWEREKDYDELSLLYPQPLSSFCIRAARRGPTTISWLALPMRARDQTGRDLVSCRWTPIGVNPTCGRTSSRSRRCCVRTRGWPRWSPAGRCVHGVAVKLDVGGNFFASGAFVDITSSAAAPRTRTGVHGDAGAERHHVDDGRSSPCTASTTRGWSTCSLG
jgi:hypothetical protein